MTGQILCEATDPRWKAFRKRLITASEVSALWDENPWLTREQLLRRKAVGDDSFVLSGPMWWGQTLEVPIIESFGNILGVRVEPKNVLYGGGVKPTREGLSERLSEPDNPVVGFALGATIDGLTEAPGGSNGPSLQEVSQHPACTPAVIKLFEACSAKIEGTGILEVKNTSAWNKKNWWDGKKKRALVPPYYWAQVQLQLYLSGYPWAIICALVGGRELIPSLILPSKPFVDRLLPAIEEFWLDVYNYGDE